MHERIAALVTTAVAVFVFTSIDASPAGAQIAPVNGCADCHFANPAAGGSAHVFAWDRSPHGRANVGCSACHGGNPATFEPALAHRSIIPPAKPNSPLQTSNIPATCGNCHRGPFTAFQNSRHYKLLRAGSDEGPTCVTCHGQTDGRVLSAKALAARCSSCHGPDEKAPRAGRMVEVRAVYEDLSVVREQMKLAQVLIKRVTDKKRHAELTFAYEQAEIPLRHAVELGHTFVYDDLRRNLSRAQEQVNALMGRLVNR
jgi:hypothetical protein